MNQLIPYYESYGLELNHQGSIQLEPFKNELKDMFLKSHHGLNISESPKSISFCGYAILHEAPSHTRPIRHTINLNRRPQRQLRPPNRNASRWVIPNHLQIRFIHLGKRAHIGQKDIRVVNRSLQTGTRLLFDRELDKAGIEAKTIKGYDHEVNSHMEVGLEILSGRAQFGPGIRPVATLLELDFISLRWERYDLLITKDRFFDKGIQDFIGLLQENEFKKTGQASIILISERLLLPLITGE